MARTTAKSTSKKATSGPARKPQTKAASRSKAKAPTPVAVPLDQIDVSNATKMRVAVDEYGVSEYAEAMRKGAKFPPVDLYFDGKTYWIGDGHHRCRAAKQAERPTIQAVVREGGERQAMLHAAGANARHGRPRTALDKRHVVMILLLDEEWGQWSDREIARRCEVTHPFVGKLRAELDQHRAAREEQRSGNGYQIPGTRTVQRGASTYTMDTSHIGTRAEPTAPTNGASAAMEEAVTFAPDERARWTADYPEFVHPGIPADDFRLIAEKLDAMPPEQRLEYRERWRRHDMNAMAELLGEPGFSAPDPQQMAGYRASDHWEKYFLDLSVLASSIQDGWGALMATWPRSRKQAALANLRQWHGWIGTWIHAVEEDLSHGTSGDDIAH
jgi:uncharacterized ParB-like nuclease family protein